MHENDHQHRLRGFKLIISTSFGESVFLAGLFQKSIKEDQNIKLNRTYPWWKLLQNVLENSRSHVTEAEGRRLPGWATQPHLQAAYPLGSPGSPSFVCRFSTTLRIASTLFILVGLIQGLRIDAPTYIYQPLPPSLSICICHKSRVDQQLEFLERRE